MSISLAPQIVAGVNLDELVDALLRADPDILEIVLFGSAAYMPELAGDIDLLVLTRAKKDYGVYLDAVCDVDTTLNVDVIPQQLGEKWGTDIAMSVVAVGVSLYGDDLAFEEAKKFMGIPTFDRARFMLNVADEILDLAHSAVENDFREEYYAKAFDTLFDAARYAAMAFLGTENSRWGQLRRQLPSPYDERFRELSSKLHIQFHYDKNYPRNETDAEFYKWRVTVNQFIDDLEAETLAQQKISKTEEHETE